MKGKFAWGGGGKESGVRSKESEDRSQEGRGGIVIPAPRVIPAKAGNQTLRVMPVFLGSGFRRNDARRRNDDAFAGMTRGTGMTMPTVSLLLTPCSLLPSARIPVAIVRALR